MSNKKNNISYYASNYSLCTVVNIRVELKLKITFNKGKCEQQFQAQNASKLRHFFIDENFSQNTACGKRIVVVTEIF